MASSQDLARMANKLRAHSVRMTTVAGSGHPTTCMSCAEIMSTLFFKQMKWDPQDSSAADVDVFVLSKGHAAPILWAALSEAGAVKEDLLSLRKMGSVLEGHPTFRSPWVRVASGSLGQGLNATLGMALARKGKGQQGRFYCLMGDGESYEGSVWEAAELASHAGCDNLVAIVDVNRLGQSQATMLGHDMDVYKGRWESFGWNTIVVDGHDVNALLAAYELAETCSGRPTAILAQTFKGKGSDLVSNKDGQHGKPIPKDKMDAVIAEFGDIDVSLPVVTRRYGFAKSQRPQFTTSPAYTKGDKVATRNAYGKALLQLGEQGDSVWCVDADVKNSTMSEAFKKANPGRFVDCFIAEQNMVGVALGLAYEGVVPFAATFACFFARAFDHIRMAGYSAPPNLLLAGSHCGVSIGQDGPSQMGLEDIAMMRSVWGSIVFYPSDAVSAEKCVAAAANHGGIAYIRTNRPATEVIYDNSEEFVVGGSKVVRSSEKDVVTIVGAGVTLHEAAKAADALSKSGINARVVDLYSVKPVDEATLRKAAEETKCIFVVEEHCPYGGLADAVRMAAGAVPVHSIAVSGRPMSASPEELLAWAGLDAASIEASVRKVLA